MLADLRCASVLWYTPSEIIEAARYTLGSIDLDPASDDNANKNVKASRIIAENSLESNWVADTVWLNPPSLNLKKKVLGTRSLASAFWRKLYAEYQAGNVKEAVYLCVSSKLLHINPDMLCQSFCLTTSDSKSDCVTGQGRIRFVNGQTGASDTTPTQTNAFVLLSNNEDTKARFQESFTNFGKVFLQ